MFNLLFQAFFNQTNSRIFLADPWSIFAVLEKQRLRSQGRLHVLSGEEIGSGTDKSRLQQAKMQELKKKRFLASFHLDDHFEETLNLDPFFQ